MKPIQDTSKVGKRGTIVIPAALRKRFGIVEGATVIAEEHEDGVLIRPAVTVPVEMYKLERVAEFLLGNAVGAEDYARARAEVQRLGLDPDAIEHMKPAGVA